MSISALVASSSPLSVRFSLFCLKTLFSPWKCISLLPWHIYMWYWSFVQLGDSLEEDFWNLCVGVCCINEGFSLFTVCSWIFIAFWVLRDGFGLDNESNNYMYMSPNPLHCDIISLAPSTTSSSLFSAINSLFSLLLLYRSRLICWRSGVGECFILEIVDQSFFLL